MRPLAPDTRGVLARSRRLGFSWRLAGLVLLGFLALATSPARAAETEAERFATLLTRLGSPDPALAITALWEAVEVAPLVDGGPQRLTASLEKAQSSKTAFLAGEARLGLARLGLLRADLGDHAERAGALHLGHLLGPFSGPGPGPAPEAALPSPIQAPEDVTRFEAADHEGKHGPTRWRPFSGASRLGPLLVEDMLPSSGDLHAFVTSVIEVERRGSATLVIGSNGPVAVWVDGTLRYEWDGERPLTDWQAALPLDLLPGRHGVLIRVGHRSAAPELTVRLVDGRGLLPVGMRWSAVGPGDVVRDGPLAATTASTTGATPVSPLEKAARSVTSRARLAGFIVRESPAERVGARALEEAIGAASSAEKAELHYLLGRAERADMSRAKAAYLEADRLAKGHAQALAALMLLADRVGLAAESDAHARRLAAISPRHPAVLSHEAVRRLEHADAGAALPVIGQDPRLPYNARLTSTLATLQERVGRIPEAADAFARLALLTAGGSEPVQRAVTLWRRGGRPDKALELVEAARKLRPHALDLHLLQARTLATLARPDALAAAVATLDGVREFHAQSPALEEARGRLLLLAGERGKAIEAFDRALALAPQDRDLADYRRVLLSERGLAERWAEPLSGLIARRDAAIKKAPEPRQAGARSIFERVVTQVFPSGLASQFRQMAIRIDVPAAAERYETMAFPFTPGEDRLEVLEAEVIRADGTRLRPELVGEQRDQGKSEGVYTLTAYRVVRFPPLLPGDVVHIQTRKDEIGSRNLFGDFFGVFFPISSDLDKAFVEAIVEAPATRTLHYHVAGLPEPKVERDGELQRLTFRAEDHPALVIEPNMPGYGDVGAWVSVSTFSSWEALTTWYRQLVLPQLEVPDDLATLARQLVSGPPESDPTRELERKVALIHGWVVEKTRYVGIEFGIHGFKPYKVSEIVKRGYGDCKDKASLLIALLRTVGVPAELVLVRTRDLGGLTGTPATLWAFNHAIAYIPGLDLYLDATAETSGLRELPDLDQDALVLRLDPWSNAPPTIARIPMQPPEENRVSAKARYVLEANGDAVVSLEEIISGSSAGRIRGRFQDPTRRDAAIAQLLASQHPGTELIDAEYDNVDRIGKPVTIRARASMPRLATRSGNTLEIPTAFEPGMKLRQMAPLTSRKQPLIVTARELEENTDIYELPAGATVSDLPAPVTLETPFATYKRTFEVETPSAPGERPRIVARHHWRLDIDRIAPSDYPAYRRLLEGIARAEGARIRIQVPAP